MQFISKRESIQLSGIAVILMVIHHVNMRSGWAVDSGLDNYWGSVGFMITRNLAMFGKICVCIFAFMSGYVLAKNPGRFNTYSQSFRRLANFLTTYWIYVSLFLLFGYLTEDRLPTMKILMGNLIGLHTGILEYVNVCFAWYVFYYIFFLLVAPLLVRVFVTTVKPLGYIWDALLGLCCLVGLSIIPILGKISMWMGLVSMWYPLISSILGIIVAKYSIFDKLSRKCANIPRSGLISICIFLVLQRNWMYDYYISFLTSGADGWMREFLIAMISILGEALCAGIFIFFITMLLKRLTTQRFVSILEFVGGLSTYIWYSHGIFLQAERYCSRGYIGHTNRYSHLCVA